jgi:hypothetical protein
MKKMKIGLGVFLAVVFIGSFFFNTVHAQVSYTIWEDAWFKINMVSKGYERNFGGTPDWLPLNEKFAAFINIGTWTDPNGSIEGDEIFDAGIYYYDDDTAGWQNISVIFHRIHGNPLDIFIWSQTDDGDISVGNGLRITFLARITGKMDRAGTSLQTGKFKTLAGYVIEMDPLDPISPLYEPSDLTMTGNLIIPATFCKSTKNQQYPPCLP